MDMLDMIPAGFAPLHRDDKRLRFQISCSLQLVLFDLGCCRFGVED